MVSSTVHFQFETVDFVKIHAQKFNSKLSVPLNSSSSTSLPFLNEKLSFTGLKKSTIPITKFFPKSIILVLRGFRKCSFLKSPGICNLTPKRVGFSFSAIILHFAYLIIYGKRRGWEGGGVSFW